MADSILRSINGKQAPATAPSVEKVQDSVKQVRKLLDTISNQQPPSGSILTSPVQSIDSLAMGHGTLQPGIVGGGILPARPNGRIYRQALTPPDMENGRVKVMPLHLRAHPPMQQAARLQTMAAHPQAALRAAWAL